jgi:hypothetical protein
MLRGLTGWARWDFDLMRRAMHRAAAGYANAGDAAGRLLAQAHEALALNASFMNDTAAELIDRLEHESLAGEALAITLHARIWQALDRGPLEDVAALFARELDLVEHNSVG